jgi:hypothetical protein
MSAWQTTYEGPEGTVSAASIASFSMIVTPDTKKGKGYLWSVAKGSEAVANGHRRSLSSAREAASTAALIEATKVVPKATKKATASA